MYREWISADLFQHILEFDLDRSTVVSFTLTSCYHIVIITNYTFFHIKAQKWCTWLCKYLRAMHIQHNNETTGKRIRDNGDIWISTLCSIISWIAIFTCHPLHAPTMLAIRARALGFFWQNLICLRSIGQNCYTSTKVPGCVGEWLNSTAFLGQRGPCDGYIPCNHNLFIGIITSPLIHNTTFWLQLT